MNRARRWVTRRFAGLAVASAVYLASLPFYGFDVPFLGDEPSYLVYATSLAHGWGVDLRRAYEPENRKWISIHAVESHAQVWRPNGPVASWHGIGLPIVLSPVASRVPSSFIRAYMIFIASALAYQLFALVRAVTRAPALIAALGVLGVMASPPIIFHASLVYPEVLAGLLVVVALRCLASERPVRERLMGVCVAAALLPWLNARYGTLTIGLGVVAVGHAYQAAMGARPLQRLASTVALMVWPAVAGLVILGGLAMFNLELYGGLLPGSTPYDRYYRFRNIYVYGIGSLIGFPLGVVPFAPLLMVALVAVPFAGLWVGGRATAAVAGVVLGYWVVNGYFGSAGFTLPGRYLVTVVPLLAIPLTLVMLKGGWAGRSAIAVTAMLTAWSTVTSATHLPEVYGPDRRNIQPFGLTQSLWPIALDETLETLATTKLSGEPGQFASQVGMIEQMNGSTYMVGREGREPLGLLSFGPYERLHHGRYEAAFDLVMEADHPVPPAQVQALDSDGHIFVTADVPFPSSGSRVTTKTVQFQTWGWLPVGLRVVYAGQGTLGVRRTSARLIELLPQRTPEQEAWKAVLWMAGLDGHLDRVAEARRPIAIRRMRCPICSSAATMPAFSATDFLLKTTPRLFHLSRCSACRTLFLDPPPSEAEIPTFYPQRYWWTASPSALKRLETVYRRFALRDHIAFIEQAAGGAHADVSSVRLLDVGCGPGTLIGILKAKGYDVLGLDLSPQAADIAARENGVRVVAGTLDEAAFPDASFSIVTLFHVLEHVIDPRAVLGEVGRVLRPDGRVVLQVPNIDSWQSRLLGARWWGLHVPRHIVDYSARSVQTLLESTGFVVRRVRHFNQRDNAPALASSLCPSLDPQVRAMRQQQSGDRESAAGSWIRHALYLALVGAALPFAVTEAAAGAGATVMVEAAKA